MVNLANVMELSRQTKILNEFGWQPEPPTNSRDTSSHAI